jgi:hypothetical protein
MQCVSSFGLLCTWNIFVYCKSNLDYVHGQLKTSELNSKGNKTGCTKKDLILKGVIQILLGEKNKTTFDPSHRLVSEGDDEMNKDGHPVDECASLD